MGKTVGNSNPQRSTAIIERLRSSYNLGVRPFELLEKKWVRISMGTSEEMETVAAALKEIG